MAINTNSLTPTVYTKTLIGDLVQAPGGSVDAPPTPTLALNPATTLTLPVSAILELQSTTGALLIPRMSTTQRNALDNTTSTICNGMMVYDSTLNDFVFYQSGAWVTLSSASGIQGPASSTLHAVSLWGNTGGTALVDSVVVINPTTGATTGMVSLTLGTALSSTGTLFFDNAVNSNFIGLKSGTAAASVTYILPLSDAATANAPLISDAAGNLSFGTAIALGTASTTTGTVTLLNSTNAHTLVLRAGATTPVSLTFTLPIADGTQANAPLVTNASGVLSFGTTLALGTASTTNGVITLLNSTNANTFTLQPGVTGSNLTFTLPTADAGVANGPLVSNGSGTLSFGTTIGLGKGSTTNGIVTLYNSTNNNTLSIRAGVTSATVTYVLPTADATTANAPLVSDASGNLSFNNLAVLSKTVTMTQADVQGAFASPKVLIAAPGAGQTIVVLSAQVYTNFQTSAFAGGGIAIIQYDTTIHGAGTNALTATIPAAEITAAASQIYGLAGVTASVLTGITNKAICFSNQTNAFTGGTASSTVVVTLQYMVLAATV